MPYVHKGREGRYTSSSTHSYPLRSIAVRGSHHAQADPLSGNKLGTHFIESGVNPTAGLDFSEENKIFCPCQDSNPDRSACSLVGCSGYNHWIRTAELDLSGFIRRASLLDMHKMWIIGFFFEKLAKLTV